MRLVLVALLLVTTTVAVAKEQIVEVTAEKLNVRASPSVEAPIVDQVSMHDRLVVNPVSNRWAAILHEGEVIGYISTKYVKLLERQNEIRFPLALFLALLGIIFLIAAFRTRLNRKQSSYEDSETLQNNRGVTVASPTQPKVQEFTLAKVEHVIDGDTIIVSSSWKKTKIRLDTIDCPEDGQDWGNIATAGLIKMIGGRRIRIEEHGEDHYGRLLATIYVQERHGSDWINVNEKMIVKGHAWVMRKFYNHLPKERKDKLNRLEKWARAKKVGLWKTQNPIPPWKWRRDE